MSHAPPQLLLFDFDGTLADSFRATLAAGNRIAAAHGYRRLSETEALALRGQSIRQILRDSEVPLRHLPSWMRQMKEELYKETPHIQPPDGMSAALASLRGVGVPLGIVTSNARKNVDLFLKNHGWEASFAHIEAGSNLFGKSRLIRRVLQAAGVGAEAAAYVGDEERDIQAARKAGIRSIAVTWGYNDRAVLERSKPDYLLDHPAELPTLFASVSR